MGSAFNILSVECAAHKCGYALVFNMTEMEKEDPKLEILIAVPAGVAESLKEDGYVVKRKNSGKYFMHLYPKGWKATNDSFITSTVELSIPSALVDQRVFVKINECLRFNEKGGLQELQTLCRRSGKEFVPLYSFIGNDQDRDQSIVYDIILADVEERIIIFKSELLGKRYINSIIGLKGQRLQEDLILLTSRWIHESYIERDKNGSLVRSVKADEYIENLYRKAIKSHLDHLDKSLKIFRRNSDRDMG